MIFPHPNSTTLQALNSHQQCLLSESRTSCVYSVHLTLPPLSSVPSLIARGLECYCDNIIVGESFPDGSCLPNKTCLIHDLSRGRCFVEKSAYFNTEKIRYGCLEVYMSDFSVEGLCNVTSEELRIHCCTDGDHCNKDVVFVDPVTDPVTATTRPTRPVTSPLLDRDSTPTGKIITHSLTSLLLITNLFFMIT